jgi:hypothetical protein
MSYLLADRGMISLLSSEFQQRDPDLSKTQERHVTSLGAAVHGYHTEVVRLMIERGANAHWSTNELGRLLKSAAERRAPRVLELLIEAADLVDCGKILEDLLIKHSHGGNKTIVQVLLDKGADVNAQGGLYGNAVQAASARAHKEIVQLLRASGASNNSHNQGYQFCVDIFPNSYFHALKRVTSDRGRRQSNRMLVLGRCSKSCSLNASYDTFLVYPSHVLDRAVAKESLHDTTKSRSMQ